MQFVDRVAALAKEKGVTEKQVLLDCGLNKNLFGLWRHGSNPNKATQRVLSDYFGVSVAYLMGETDDRGQKNTPVPSNDTGDMLDKKISLLSEAERAAIERQVDELLIKRLSEK